MASSVNSPIPADVLLEAYKARVKAEIESELMAEVMPKVEAFVRKAAETAAKALEAAIHQRYDAMQQESLVRIDLRITKELTGEKSA